MATSEEMSGHEIGGESGNPSAVFSSPTESEGGNGGEGYGGAKYAATTFGGGTRYSNVLPTSDNDEEIAAHEIGGINVNINAIFPIDNLPAQYVGCGNGYAGVAMAAMMYGGAVPCVGATPTDSSQQTVIKSNVEEFCILEYSCAS